MQRIAAIGVVVGASEIFDGGVATIAVTVGRTLLLWIF
jgi:hypothetical protein